MPTLNELWNTTLNIGYNVRKNKKDGLKAWQPLKSEYVNYLVDGKKTLKINKNLDNLENLIYDIGNDITDHTDVKVKIGSEILDNTTEIHHFFIQHFRIPKMGNYELPIIKLLQIAYNAGQYKCEEEKKSYSKTVVDFYNTHKLAEIITYIDADKAQLEISYDMPINKGGCYTKYIKYKSKYLNLKRNKWHQ